MWPRRRILRLSRRHWLLGQSHPRAHAPDRLLRRGEGQGGYFVPDRRLSPGLGWRFSPGSVGVNAGCCIAARPDSQFKKSAHDPCPFGPSLSTCFGWFGLTTIQARLHRTVIHARLCWAGFPVRFRVTAGCPMHRPAWMVKPRGVGHAVTGSPPGWELHPHAHRVVRSRSPCGQYPGP